MKDLKTYILESQRYSKDDEVNAAIESALNRMHPNKRHSEWIDYCVEKLETVNSKIEEYVKKYNVSDSSYKSLLGAAHSIQKELTGDDYSKDNYFTEEGLLFDALCLLLGNYLMSK